jgi:hypothetical protein
MQAITWLGRFSGIAALSLGMLGGSASAQTFGGSNGITVSSTVGQSQGSSASVSGLSGTVTAMSLTMTNLNVSNLDSVAIVLVAPGGAAALDLLSSVCGFGTQQIGNSTFTLADTATSLLPNPGSCPSTFSGTFLPTDYVPGQDVFNSPGPSSYKSGGNGTAGTGTFNFSTTFLTLATSALNGTWNLYIANQTTPNPSGSLGSWTLTFTTSGGQQTTTSLSAGSPNPAFSNANGGTAQPVTFTATVTPNPSSGGGTVTFFEDGTAVGSNVAVNSLGQATTQVTFTSDGVHAMTAKYNGGTGFGPSPTSNTVNETVYNHPTGPTTNPDGSTAFCNGPVSLGSNGGGNPYPSLIILSGAQTLSGTIEKLSVTLNGLQTQNPQFLGFGLQAPGASSAYEFLSWADGNTSTIGSGINLTLSDTGTATIPATTSASCPFSSPCLPTDNHNQVTPGERDTFPSPAPTTVNTAGPTGSSTFANQFGGLGANGNWSLYLDNRATQNAPLGQVGSWCLNFTMQANANPTTTSVTGSPNLVLTTGTVTLTATVSSTGGTVNAGSVTFVDGTATLGTASVSNGTATLNNISLAERTHQIFANYSGTNTGTIFGISSGHFDLRVNAPTNESGTLPYSYCNTGSIAIPGLSADDGAASPYPSNIFVTSLPGTVKAVTVTLNNFSTNDVNDLASLLVGPGGNNLDFFSFTGASPGADTFGPVNLTFDDNGSHGVINGFDPNVTGSYKPTSFNAGGNLLAYPACPPNVTDCLSANVGPPLSTDPFTPTNKATTAGTGILGNATNSGVFGGTPSSTYNGNGTWSLYLDDAPHGAGRQTTISGGWCVNLTENLPDISLTATPMTHSPSTFTRGQSASFTVTASNLGPGPTGNPTLTITDTLPTGLTYASASGTGWTCGAVGQVVTCTNSTPIASGSSSAVTINVTVGNTTADSITNSASNNSTGGDDPTTTANDTTSSGTIQVAGTILTINKTHTDPFTQGQNGATYSITVTNTGASGTGTGPGVTTGTITVTDTIPSAFVVTGFSGTGWTCQPLPALMCTLNSSLGVGATTGAITLTVNVPTTLLGPVTNTANLQALSDQIGPNSDNTHNDPTNITQVPTQMSANGGTTPQSTLINTAFTTLLGVTVLDAGNNPVPNVNVTFTPPASGASGTFAVVSNGTQTCTASGCVVKTNSSGVATASTFTANGTANTYNVHTTSGTLTPVDFSLTNTDTPATVTGVSSTTANGSYGTGSVIAVTVTFNKAVNVTGTPLLALNSGGSASYSSGSGTSTLTFNYTVAAGQNANPLDEASTTALTLNGGTIQNLSTVNATLTLPAPGGAGALGVNKTIKVDTTKPTVTNVSSTTANGSYTTAAVIAVTVTFSKPVVVTGTPQLALNSGGTASYASGSGTSTLTFNYTVASGQNSPHLDYTSTTALTLNGGTIVDTVTNPNSATLTLPAPAAAGSLSANTNIVIDTTAPTVTNVSSTTANGTYGTGSNIAITVTFSENVNVTGTPQLALNSGGTASYSSGSGTNTLTFTYTVVSGQNSAHLDYTSTAALTLNGGTIKDAATNAATLTLPAPGAAGSLGANTNLVIDTTAPAVTNVTSTTANGTYGVGATVNVTVTFSKSVNVTGTPLLALNSGGTASYASGTGTGTLTFTYTVASGQNSAHLDYTATTALSLNGGTIKDSANNNATLTLPAPGAAGSLSANTNIVINTTPPTVTNVSSTTANGTYGVGANIAITVTFSGAVNVTGTPLLALNSGGTASYTSGTGTSTLTFNYTVASGQNSAKLDYTSTGALTLNGGTIKDSANNNATLTLPAPGAAGSLSANKNIVINTTAPTVTNVSSTTSNGTYGVGASIAVTVTFSSPVNVTGTPQLALNSGGTASYASGTGTSTLTFSYTVSAGQNSAHLDYTSTAALSLNGGTIQDLANNNAVLTLPAPGAAGSLGANKSIVIDTTAPTVTNVSSTTANGTYGTGANIAITVTFSKVVNVTGTPLLALNSGGTAGYSSGSGTNTLTFAYTVASGQSSAHLDYTSTAALALNGGTIKDAALNNAVLTLPAPGAAGSLSANTNIVINTKTTPTITWSNPADVVFGSALSSVQLNATASVAGTFVYTPPAGTVLPAGAGQTLSVQFTPTDTTNYNNASASVLINVTAATGPATLVITRTLARDPNNNDVLVTLTIANTGGSAATAVSLNSAKVGTAVTTTPLPLAVPDIAAGGSQSVTLRFAAGSVGSSGSVAVLSVGGSDSTGSFGGSSRVTLP